MRATTSLLRGQVALLTVPAPRPEDPAVRVRALAAYRRGFFYLFNIIFQILEFGLILPGSAVIVRAVQNLYSRAYGGANQGVEPGVHPRAGELGKLHRPSADRYMHSIGRVANHGQSCGGGGGDSPSLCSASERIDLDPDLDLDPGLDFDGNHGRDVGGTRGGGGGGTSGRILRHEERFLHGRGDHTELPLKGPPRYPPEASTRAEPTAGCIRGRGAQQRGPSPRPARDDQGGRWAR